MADMGLFYNIGQQVGGAVSGGVSAYEATRKARLEAIAHAALARFNAGDIQGAHELAKVGNGALGLAGPKLIETPATEGAAALTPQGPTPTGAPLAATPAVAATPAHIDYKAPDNLRAVAGEVGVAAPGNEYHYSETGGLIRIAKGYAGQPDTISQPIAPIEKPIHVGAGEKVYKDGKLVADNPKEPTSHVVGAGGVLVGPDGKPVYASPNRPSTARPQLVPSYNPDGTVTYVEGAPGVTVNAKPPASATPKTLTDGQLMDEAKKLWARPYPQEGRTASGKPNGIATGGGNVPIQAAKEAWDQGVRTIYDDLKGKQGKPGAAPTSSEPVPHKRTTPWGQHSAVPANNASYNPGGALGQRIETTSADFPVQLVATVTDAIRTVGGTITSQGNRPVGSPSDTAATKVNGHQTQWGLYNSLPKGYAAYPGTSEHGNGRAVDVYVPPHKQAAARAHLESLGIKIFDEKDHWHLTAPRGLLKPGGQNPMRSASAGGEAEQMAALYQQFGIIPGAADRVTGNA